jgi:hypothetical protein
MNYNLLCQWAKKCRTTLKVEMRTSEVVNTSNGLSLLCQENRHGCHVHHSDVAVISTFHY